MRSVNVAIPGILIEAVDNNGNRSDYTGASAYGSKCYGNGVKPWRAAY